MTRTTSLPFIFHRTLFRSSEMQTVKKGRRGLLERSQTLIELFSVCCIEHCRDPLRSLITTLPLRRCLPSEVKPFVRQKPRDKHSDTARPKGNGNTLNDNRRAKDEAHQMCEGNQEENYPDRKREHMLAHIRNLLPLAVYLAACRGAHHGSVTLLKIISSR